MGSLLYDKHSGWRMSHNFHFFLSGLSLGSLHLLGHPHSVSDHIFLIQVSSVHKVITVALFFWHSLERNHTSITHWNWHQRETISWQIPFPWFAVFRITIAYDIKMEEGGVLFSSYWLNRWQKTLVSFPKNDHWISSTALFSRISVHKNMFISMALNNAAWIIW